MSSNKQEEKGFKQNEQFNNQFKPSNNRNQVNCSREFRNQENLNEDQAIINIHNLNGEVQNVQRLLQQRYTQCNNSCTQNMKDVRRQIELSLQNKYESQFTFYFSKPINELLSNYPTHHVVLFKEYLFIDDENEYLKRFYFSNEHSSRLDQLLTFYQEVFPPFSPNLYAIDTASIMIKRNNAQDKIFFIENERKLRQPPETQREQIEPAQEDLYLESQSSIAGDQQESKQNNQENYKNNDMDDENLMSLNMDDIENHNQNFLLDKDNEVNKYDNHLYELYNNQHAIEYYNDDIQGINQYIQQKNNKNSQEQQEYQGISQKNFQKQRNYDGEQINQHQEKNTPRGQQHSEKNENLEKRLQVEKGDVQTIKDQLQNSNKLEKDNLFEQRKKFNTKQDQISHNLNSQGADYDTPRDDLKFNPSKYKENFGFEENVREAFILANQNSQRRNKEQQRREWDTYNRGFSKNIMNQEENIHVPIENRNQINKQYDNQFDQFGDEDVQEVYNILYSQDQKNHLIHNQNFGRKSTELEFGSEFGADKDFSLNTQELIDENNSNQNQYTQAYNRKQEGYNEQDIQIRRIDNNEDHDDNSNIQMFSDLKKKNSQSDSQERDGNYQEDDMDDLNNHDEENQKGDFFGEGSFMKDLNNYEMEISYETATYDVFNPSFSSEQNESFSKQFYKEEEALYQEILDVQDYEDIMKRYAVGKDEVCNVCSCLEFSKNKENLNKNADLSHFDKQNLLNRQNPIEEKGILKQQNIQTNKHNNSQMNIVKQINSNNEIFQIKKGVSSQSLQQVKNHSSTVSNQNNYLSSSSMKSSHNYQQQHSQQPEDYQILQQYLQQQIQQQQLNLIQNPQQKSKSVQKQQHSQEMIKYGKDLSPRNMQFLLDINDLNPNYQSINQNFNEILQAQIQNQILIKQRLEQSKAENSTSNKLIEQNQQYYTNHSTNKLENSTSIQQSNQQFQQIHNSSSQNTLINAQQSRNNNHNSSNSIINQKNNIFQSNNNCSIPSNQNPNNSMSNHLSLNSVTQNLPPSNQKPVYNNTKKKLANQLQTQNHTTSSSLLNVPQANIIQNNVQEKNSRLKEILTSNGQQNISQNNYIQSTGSDASQVAQIVSIIKNGQNSIEIGLGTRSKFFDQNQIINEKKSENSSIYNTLDSTKKPIPSFIEQSQGSHSIVYQNQNQSSKLKSNPSNNNASQLSTNQVQNPTQTQQIQHPNLISNGVSQQFNQNKINPLLNSQTKNPNSSTCNLKNTSTKSNTSSQQQLEMLTMNQQSQLGMEKSLQLKPYNQLSQHLTNQNKVEKNIGSLAASTTSSQKGFNNTQQYHQITQNNPMSKVRNKMHGKEKRNTSINQSNPGSISLSNIKKQSFLNQFDTPQQQINKQIKHHNSHIQSDNQQQELLQYFQSPTDSTQLHKQQQENLLFNKINEKKLEQQQVTLSSPQDKISQQYKSQLQQQQPQFQPQKRQSENKIQPQIQNGIRFTNKSISHSQNLYQKDEAVRASMNSYINTVNSNSQKKNQEIGVIHSVADVNWNPILMKQGSKDSIGQRTLEINNNNNKLNASNQAQNPLSKSSALNIEVQRRISLKHLKIKENSHYIGVNKNNSIEKEPSSVTQVQQRWNETNLAKKQNSIKQNQKRFPHLNNSVGDPSPIKKKDDTSNVQSVQDSHREIQYSNNSHHNQIVTSLLSLHQVNPQIEQIIKKPTLNFLPQTKTNSNQQTNNHQIESASKLAIGIYQQNIHKTTLGSQSTAVINSLPTNNSYNHSRTFNINNYVGPTGISQSNSRMNSQEKILTRPNKNKSVDENTRKKKIVQQSYQQNSVFNSQNGNQQVRKQQSPSNSLPHQQQQQQYYYPSSIQPQIVQVPQNFGTQFMSPQQNSYLPVNQMQQTIIHTNQNQNSIDNSFSPIIDKQHQVSQIQPHKQFNVEENITNSNIQNPSYQQNNQQQKSRIKQNNILFASQISQSLQQSQNSMHQYKNSTNQQQNLAQDHQLVDNQISSPRFKKILSKNPNIQIEQYNQIQNGSNSQSSTPSQSNIANQQQQQNPSNIQPEKEKPNNNNQVKNIKGFQKKQVFHHSQSTNINHIKKNNFIKQQDNIRASQQQHTSMGDGVSQNSSYGFLTSRSFKKSQKELQGTQKINAQESPYNIDGIKRENKQQLQQVQQQIQNPVQQFTNQQNCVQLGNKFFILNN